MEYLHTYGYPVIFGWTFIEGETFVIVAGAMAQQGLFNIWLVMLCAFAGSFCGDQAWFYIGRYFGPKVIARLPRLKPVVDSASEMLRRWDAWFILSFRLIYGVRNVAPFAIGNAGISPLRYFVLNMIAAFVWANLFAGGGYIFGSAFHRVMGEAEHYGYLMVGLLVLILFVVWLSFKFAAWRRRRRDAAAAAIKAGAE